MIRAQVRDLMPMLIATGIVVAFEAHLPVAVILMLIGLLLIAAGYGIARRIS